MSIIRKLPYIIDNEYFIKRIPIMMQLLISCTNILDAVKLNSLILNFAVTATEKIQSIIKNMN
jgi:hypothetical protein